VLAHGYSSISYDHHRWEDKVNMTFSSEKHMKNVASTVLSNEFRRGSVQTISEFDYGPGRADLVFADISDKYIEHRVENLNINGKIDSKTKLRVFLQLHNKEKITEDYFYQIGAISPYKKSKALEWLIDEGFVVRQGNKLYTAPDLRRHVTTTISVELKLSKWKRALQQAKRGRSFANYRFVAMDEENTGTAVENIDKFKESNVGLILINPQGEITFEHYPSRINPYSELNRWKINESTLRKSTSNAAAD
jgi:hypothetical protein